MSDSAFCHSTSVLDGAAARCTPVASHPGRSAVPPVSDRFSSGIHAIELVQHGLRLVEPFADAVGLGMASLRPGVIHVLDG